MSRQHGHMYTMTNPSPSLLAQVTPRLYTTRAGPGLMRLAGKWDRSSRRRLVPEYGLGIR